MEAHGFATWPMCTEEKRDAGGRRATPDRVFFFPLVWRVEQTTTAKLPALFVVRLFRTCIPSTRCSAVEDRSAATTDDSFKVAAPCWLQRWSVVRRRRVVQPAVRRRSEDDIHVHALPGIWATFFFFFNQCFCSFLEAVEIGFIFILYFNAKALTVLGSEPT